MSDYQPVIIIGAGRSGTNMLRDSLCTLDCFSTWPCDEINYIWRHGNRSYPNDEIPASLASSKSSRYVQAAFSEIAARKNCQFVVEKTCANSLRVPFVASVVPNAKFIFIVRNGSDVVASAMKRWGADLDIKYIAAKARYVPVSDIPYYGFRYGMHRIRKLFKQGQTLPSWGPVYEGMKDDLASKTLEEVCALQWRHCVEKSEQALSAMNQRNVYQVRYEDFVRDPVEKMGEIVGFLRAGVESEKIAGSVQHVTDKSVGIGVKLFESNSTISGIVDVQHVII